MDKKQAQFKMVSLKKELKELEDIINAPQSIFEICLSYEDAASLVGEDPIHSLPYMDPKTPNHIQINAFHKLLTIAQALNEGSNKQIYTPWFKVTSGGGFSFGAVLRGAHGAYRNTSAGLCVQDEERANFFGTQFLPIWKEFYGI